MTWLYTGGWSVSMQPARQVKNVLEELAWRGCLTPKINTVMHTANNVIITTLLLEGHVSVAPGAAFRLTPSWEGMFSMILIAAAGLWLTRQRA